MAANEGTPSSDSDNDITYSSPPPPIVTNESSSIKRTISLPSWMASPNTTGGERIGHSSSLWVGNAHIFFQYSINTKNQISIFAINDSRCYENDRFRNYKLSIHISVGKYVGTHKQIMRQIVGIPIIKCNDPVNEVNGWSKFGNSSIFQKHGCALFVKLTLTNDPSILIIDKTNYEYQDEMAYEDGLENGDVELMIKTPQPVYIPIS